MTARWFPDAMPSPAVDDESRPFFEACLEHRLTVQRCDSCSSLRHPPRPICAVCHETGSSWHEVPGTGTVFTYTVVHQPLHPALAEHVPYAVVVVTLDDTDGVRLTSNLVDSDPGEISIGAPVSLVWEDMSADLSLPRFRLSDTTP